MENITVIIPLHKTDEKFNDYFINCVKSLKSQTSVPSNVLIVRSQDDKLKNYLENEV